MPNIINLKKEEKIIEKPDDSSNPEPEKQIKQQEPVPEKKEDNYLEWITPEFEYYKNSRNWFIITGAIAAALFIIAIFTKNFLFAILIGLSYFLIITYALKEPNNVKILINPRGVKLNNVLYEFQNLSSFWISYNPPRMRELSLRSKKTIMPYIKIPIGEKNPVEIRRILIKYLPEKHHKESIIDNLAKNLKF